MTSYTKTPEQPEKLVEILKQRGVVVTDDKYAETWLVNTGYYRFTGYGLHFRQRDSKGARLEAYEPGTKFEEIVSLYEFDRHLRLLVLDAIERFEVGFRSRFNNVMALQHGSSHWFLLPGLFTTATDPAGRLYFDPNEFGEAAIKHSKGLSIRHYNSRYGDPVEPPCWMIAEVSTFGLYSRAYSNLLDGKSQKAVSDQFYLSVKDLKSFAQALNNVRNTCAHHGRLWDTILLNGPRISDKLKSLIRKGAKDQNQELFPNIAALLYCLWSIEPQTRWLERLDELMAGCPSGKLHVMGFPPDWKAKLIALYPKDLNQPYPYYAS